MPHLLFYGPPGTGKTSTIIAVARELFGPKFRENGRYLELNASDDRGITVVREKVKSFAQGAISGSSTMPPFKIIVLDEADSMTNDAQSALRRMMENYSKVTRFCLICNYVSRFVLLTIVMCCKMLIKMNRIIEPVASRCAKFRYQPLEKVSMTSRIQYVCEQESVSCSQDAMDTLLEVSGGDLRKAINYLQSAKQLNGDEITKEDMLAIAGVRIAVTFVAFIIIFFILLRL